MGILSIISRQLNKKIVLLNYLLFDKNKIMAHLIISQHKHVLKNVDRICNS